MRFMRKVLEIEPFWYLLYTSRISFPKSQKGQDSSGNLVMSSFTTAETSHKCISRPLAVYVPVTKLCLENIHCLL